VAEAAFLYKAAGLGFGVAKPWGESERYDFILDSGDRLWRAQVKCTTFEADGGYPVHADSNRGDGRPPAPYTAEEIDVFIAHLVPLDIWYVVPVEAFAPRSVLRFYPDGRERAEFEEYRDAWHLLWPRKDARKQKASAASRRKAGKGAKAPVAASSVTPSSPGVSSTVPFPTATSPTATSPVVPSSAAKAEPGVWPNVRRPILQREFLERWKRLGKKRRAGDATQSNPEE